MILFQFYVLTVSQVTCWRDSYAEIKCLVVFLLRFQAESVLDLVKSLLMPNLLIFDIFLLIFSIFIAFSGYFFTALVLLLSFSFISRLPVLQKNLSCWLFSPFIDFLSHTNFYFLLELLLHYRRMQVRVILQLIENPTP